MLRITSLVVTLIVALLGFQQQATAEPMWKEGVHYTLLPYPVRTRDPSKVEVVEVFWYGCPHCYEFYRDHLIYWEKTLPKDVDFWLSPAAFGKTWTTHAKMFFAAKELGVQKKLHGAMFDAIQKQHRRLDNMQDIRAFLVEHGVDGAAFDKLFEKQGFRKVSKIDQAVDQAKERAKSYRVSGVPAIIVNGKYKIGVREAGSFSNMLKITNYLIAKERKHLASSGS